MPHDLYASVTLTLGTHPLDFITVIPAKAGAYDKPEIVSC